MADHSPTPGTPRHEPVQHDAVIVAGGRGTRMGGTEKADVQVGGRRLLDLVLDATTRARQVVVVGRVDVPAGVRRTMEDPPGQGPAAGLAAGLDALEDAAPWVLVLACDLPGAGQSAGPLLAAGGRAGPDLDGVCLVDDTGHRQWLTALYRTGPLRAALTGLAPLDGVPMKAVARQLRLGEVTGLPAGAWDDIDTWADLDRWHHP